MNAGSALGLLAGLGAINALGGGKDGKRFTSLIDMIDGGGAGQSGDKFEGGGLLSMLGNLFAKPYEAQDNVERIAATRAAAKAVPTAPAPSYANMNRGEAGRGFMPPVAVKSPSYANMDMGEMGRGSMPPASDPYAYLFQGQGQQPQATPAPQVGVTSSGLLPEQATPSASSAPSASMSLDPMMRGTRNPSAYAPMQPMPEAQPAIDQSSGPMTFEQYAPYITKKYQMEYGTNETLSPEKLQQAYAIYRQSVGM